MRYIILLQGIQLITREELNSLQEVVSNYIKFHFISEDSLGKRHSVIIEQNNGRRIHDFTSSSGSRLTNIHGAKRKDC